jgi:hypothetical protein
MMCGLVNGFIDHLYARVNITSKYSALANFHTLRITTDPAKPFSSLLSLQQLFPSNDF